MESFRVVCETCGARLRVRDTSIIGEIHACPKCESMVQIVPPTGQHTVSTEAPAVQVDSTVQPTEQAATLKMEFVEAVAPSVPVAATSVPLMLWGVGGGALLLVGLAIGMWAGGTDAADDSAPAAVVTDSEAEVERPVARDPYAVSPAAEVADEPTETEASEPPVEQVAKKQADDRLPAPELPALPADEQDSPSKGAESAPTEDDPPQPVATATSKPPRPAILRFDPLDFDPTRLSLPSSTSSTSAPVAGSIADDPATDVEMASEESLADAVDDLLSPPARDESLYVRLGPMPSPASHPNAAEQLDLRVDSFDVSELPLVQFVDVVSDMAGVPITLDPAALELAGLSPVDSVSVHGRDVSLKSLLKDALSTRRLDVVERDAQARVVLRDGERRRRVEYEVKDLAGGADASDVAKLVERFVAPATWQSAGGEGTVAVDGTKLSVEQTQAVHHAILIFCERLRLARGLPPRSRYPAERLSIESAYTAVATKLKQPTTFTFLPWERLRDVVDYWQRASRLTILVDWSALADAGRGPSSPIECSVIDRSWSEAFDGILEPLGLGWWAVDGTTIQITSRETLAAMRRVEFYAVPDALRERFATGESLVESLTTELREPAGGGGPTSVPMSLELDERSGRLIVLAPPAVHRHLSQLLSGEAD